MGSFVVSKSRIDFMDKLNYFLNLYYNESNEDLEKEISKYYELDKIIVNRLINNVFNIYKGSIVSFNNISGFVNYLDSKNSSLIYKNKKDLYLNFSSYLYSFYVKNLEFISEVELVICVIYLRNIIESDIRFYFNNKGMYSLITEDYLDRLSEVLKNKKVLEVCSGQGFLGKGLFDRGVSIKCTDDFSWKDKYSWGRNKFSVEKLDAINALNKYIANIDIVIVSWVPHDSTLDVEILRYIRANNADVLFFVIGESPGGATGSELLFDEGNIVHDKISRYVNEKKDRFNGISERLYIFS